MFPIAEQRKNQYAYEITTVISVILEWIKLDL